MPAAENTVEIGDVEVRTAQLTLGDGRVLAWAEFGAADGPALLHFHGTGSCRLEAWSGHRQAVLAGVRIIAPDRPGAGRSDPDPGRSLQDWAADVVALADHLGLDRFAVSGMSAGGPHALACADALPLRTTLAALINTSPELRGPLASAIPAPTRTLIGLSTVPWLLRAALAISGTVFRGRPVEMGLPSEDRALLAGELKPLVDILFGEGLRQGSAAAAEEVALVLRRPWRISYPELRVPVRMYQTARDASLPFARRLVAVLPDAALLVLPGGHFAGLASDVWRHVTTLVRAAA